MEENKHTENNDSNKETDSNNDSLIQSLQEKFPQKGQEEIKSAIEIAGPDQKDIENYLKNPVNGEGFTPTH